MKRLGSVHKNGPIEVHQLPARTDNYIYILRHTLQNITWVIDPTEASIVIDHCQSQQWQIDAILITHHHPDHVGGNRQIKEIFKCPIYALEQDAYRIPEFSHALQDGSQLYFGDSLVQVFFTPGHTLGHICFYLPQAKWLFCGDTLFSMGCGRLFEGTPEMMLASLKKIRSLPADTLFFCSHEYTQSNVEFALSIDPHNQKLIEFQTAVIGAQRLSRPTVPAPLAQEFLLNPMLRWDDSQLKQNLLMDGTTELETFTRIRELRNLW